jgi:hypothetical protein
MGAASGATWRRGDAGTGEADSGRCGIAARTRDGGRREGWSGEGDCHVGHSGKWGPAAGSKRIQLKISNNFK